MNALPSHKSSCSLERVLNDSWTSPRSQVDLNARLRQAMRERGLTDKTAASLLGVATSTFSSWMTSRAPWRPGALYKLCEALEIDPWEAASQLGLLPGDAHALLARVQAEGARPLFADMLGVKEPASDQVGRVVRALIDAKLDVVVRSGYLGRKYRTRAHTLLAVLPGEGYRGGEGDNSHLDVRRCAARALEESGIVYAHWEENPLLLEENFPDLPMANVLTVEDVFGPVPLGEAAETTRGPFCLGGVYFTGANVMPRLLHDHLGWAAVNVSAAFAAHLHQRGAFSHEAFVQEAMLADLLRFPPFDQLVASADDCSVLTRTLRRLEAGQWRPTGTFIALTLDPSMLPYASYSCAKSVERDSPRDQAASPEWWQDYLLTAQSELIDVARRLFGANCLEYPVALPEGIAADGRSGGWPNGVHELFDRHFEVAKVIARDLVPSAAEKWFRKAAEDGHIEAMFRLGDLLSDAGRQDEAEPWFRKAAEDGHIEAMFRLGDLLSDAGRQDEAEPWFRKAAEDGHIEAMFRITLGGS